MREIVIVGFPKCGTSALVRAFEEEADCHVLRSPTGSVDVRLPDRTNVPADKIIVHKCPSYILQRVQLEKVRDTTPDGKIVLCYRALPRVLVSWHNMHQRIARKGTHPNHFVHKEPDFWANCTLDEYYQKSTHRFRYDYFFSQLTKVFPAERLTLVSQERMARSVRNVVKLLKDEEPVEEERDVAHKGFADKAEAEIDPEILAILDATYARFLEQAAASGARIID